jgi:uncharacterized membrane protein YeaQ/YmgE (transglycosylase-associated protein family)
MAALQPYMPYIMMAVTGLIAGWLAGLLLGGGGLLRNLVVGIAGALLAGALINAGVVKLPFTTGTVAGDQIAASTIGAIAIIVIARIIGR